MPDLLLGPLLRYVSATEATIWVKTSAACEVEIRLGDGEGSARAQTFCVSGHHFALVVCEELPSGQTLPYVVALDGAPVWPLADDPYPPCVVRTHATVLGEDEGTMDGRGDLRVVFGSCRVSVPHELPYTAAAGTHPEAREVDALLALTERMRTQPPEDWPDVLLLLGDQVYADDVSPATQELIDARRPEGQGPPREEVADIEEYLSLYHESWRDPSLRWLLSTVSTAMIFDDHDVHDDWNASQTWVEQIREKDWWAERITSAFATYWICQHLGNLSPAELRAEPTFQALGREPDATALVRTMARRADDEIADERWSYRRDFGRTRLLMLDSRAGRVLTPGRRQMLSDDQWAWVREQVDGDYDHLLIGTSIPVLVAHGLFYLEAWNEALCDGAWGRPAAWLAEQMRQTIDLEHWPAFQRSFTALSTLIEEVACGEHGPAPATITILSGDVHHAYLAEARPASGPTATRILQAVCSPVRNPLAAVERRVQQASFTRPMAALGRAAARRAGVAEPGLRWGFAAPPTFDNQIAELRLEGRTAHLRIEKTRPEDRDAPRLHDSLSLTIEPR